MSSDSLVSFSAESSTARRDGTSSRGGLGSRPADAKPLASVSTRSGLKNAFRILFIVSIGFNLLQLSSRYLITSHTPADLLMSLTSGNGRGTLTLAGLSSRQLFSRDVRARGAGARQQKMTGWAAALQLLRTSSKKYVICEVKNGLGNRMRALASTMAVANKLDRPMMLIWVPDLHCNCSFRRLFAPPLQFTLLEEYIPHANLSTAEFQLYNYMRPEPGAIKDQWVEPDRNRHLYFKSAFIMNHPYGKWKYAQAQLQSLFPAPEVREKLVADKRMIGVHIRNIFDAPRDAATNESTVGKEALNDARKEYGAQGAQQLMVWRRASHWSNFVPRISSLLREKQLSANSTLRFYLAADSDEAYNGLQKRFPNELLFTKRPCSTKRCDFRDCEGMKYSLVDMLNLARTRLILGSGYSSYSEVAAFVGGASGKSVPMLMAGRDFGELVDKNKAKQLGPGTACCNTVEADLGFVALPEGVLAGASEEDCGSFSPLLIQQHWPKPF